MTVLTSSSNRAGQGVSQDHFGYLIHHMVLEITLGSHFRLRSHFSENSVKEGALKGDVPRIRRPISWAMLKQGVYLAKEWGEEGRVLWLTLLE